MRTVKNAWSYTSTPQYDFISWCLVKQEIGVRGVVLRQLVSLFLVQYWPYLSLSQTEVLFLNEADVLGKSESHLLVFRAKLLMSLVFLKLN